MLETVDLTQTLSPEEYHVDLIRLQVRLSQLGFQVYKQQRPVIIAFEGWDAAGKGGAIRRLTERLDPRDDAEHHYLWRFWRRLPEAGQIAVFDRTWYGRVLVERVEGFCSEEEWRRAYREINEFERQLVDYGTVLVKFWLHISSEAQLARFEDRRDTAYKAWKLTDEDWRNRDKWDRYMQAVEDMLLKTSTTVAPWTVVPANDKLFARVCVLQTVVNALESALDLSFEKGPRHKRDSRKKKREKQ
jgi:polyphosphate kinase 2 (PPK2 family)